MSAETKHGLRTGDSPKNVFIEVWRGIAVALVVYFHYTGRLPPSAFGVDTWATLPFYSGKVGVLIFFIISAYLITQSLHFSRSLGSFYAKRLSRIWPLFIIAAITVYAFTKAIPPPVVDDAEIGFNRQAVGFADLVGTLFFLYDLGFRWVDGAFWSILVELKFYVIIGLFAARWPGNFARKFAIFAVALSFVQLAIDLLLPSSLQIVSGVLNRILVADSLPFFAIGVLLYMRDRGPLLTAAVLLAFVQAGLAAASNPLFDTVATLRFLLVFAAVVGADAWLLRSRIFLFLGKYSYALYLFHQMIGIAIIARLAPQVGIDGAAALAFGVALGLAITASWLVEWRFRDLFYDALRAVFAKLGLDRLRVSDREPERAIASVAEDDPVANAAAQHPGGHAGGV